MSFQSGVPGVNRVPEYKHTIEAKARFKKHLFRPRRQYSDQCCRQNWGPMVWAIHSPGEDYSTPDWRRRRWGIEKKRKRPLIKPAIYLFETTMGNHEWIRKCLQWHPWQEQSTRGSSTFVASTLSYNTCLGKVCFRQGSVSAWTSP
jgi:hypothetical protein